MDQQGFRFSRRSSDLDSQIGSLFCGILAGGFEAGGELGQIFPGGLAGNFQNDVSAPETGFGPAAFLEDGEDLGSGMADDAEAFGKIGNLHGGWGNAWGGLQDETKIFREAEFDDSTEFDRIGPDGSVGPIHDFPFRFRHEVFRGDLGLDAGKRFFIHAPFGSFFFAVGKSDGTEDCAENGPGRKNFVRGQKKILGQNDTIVFDFEGKCESKRGVHHRIPFCGKALGKESKTEKEGAGSFRKHGWNVVLSHNYRGRHGFDSNWKRPAASRGPGLVGLVKKPIHKNKS